MKKSVLGGHSVGAHAFNPISLDVEADEALWVWGKTELQSEFRNNQVYTDKPASKKKIPQKHILRNSTWEFSKIHIG